MKYQVEYMSRPDEAVDKVPFGTEYLKACALARRMSKAYDIAYVIALSDVGAVGEAVYVSGARDHVEGTLKDAAKPATVQE